MKRILAVLLSAILLSSAAVLSGCKNEGEENDSAESAVTESKSTNNAAASAEKLAAISTELEAYKSQPSFSGSETIDAKKISKGKKIAIVSDSSSSTYSSYIAQEIKTAAEKAGFSETVIYDTDGTSSSHASALENAVSDQCALALLIGNIDKDELTLSIETAQANGLKVLSLDNAQTGSKEHFVDFTIAADYVSEAKALADYAIVKNEGKVNALLIAPSDVGYSEEMRKAVTDELANYSEGYCTEITAEISTSASISETVQKALERDTNINCVIVLHNDMVKDTVDALEMAQAMSRVTLLARGGGTELFTQVKNGNITSAVSESYEWTAYIALDCILRVLGGNDSPEVQGIPYMMISYDNVKELEEGSQSSDGEDSEESEETVEDDTPLIEKMFTKDFKEQYLTLWGISSEESSEEVAE